ncbi:MAG: GvpL/GvpF family gas vesicle protein [Acidimicrobiales bacterium]
MTDTLYIYGVVRAGRTSMPTALAPVGPTSGQVSLVAEGNVAALVSPLDSDQVRMTHENLEAHQAIVEASFSSGVTLPMRFGVVIDSAELLVDAFLGPQQTELSSALDRFEDRSEMRVVARYKGDAALKQAAAGSPRIRRLRERVSHRPEAATYYDRIALGEEVLAALESVRSRDTEALSERLRPFVVAERPLRRPDDETACRLAYLVATAQLGSFDAELSKIGDEQHDRMDISVVGPLAPWDFVELGAGLPTPPRDRGNVNSGVAG